MNVYKAINAVQSELAKIGITKDGRNTQGKGYNFRGIDQVYNTLSPLLSKHGLCILPRVVKSQQAERTSSNGNALIYSYVTMEFDLVCAEDGSKHTICTVGEAFDSGDKSMNKAMSAAYKYAAFQSFAIPTEGDNDADAHTYDVAPAPIIHRPVSGAIVPDDEKPFLDDLARDLIAVIKEQRKLTDGMAMLHAAGLEPEQKIYLWSLLPSDVRSQIKTAEKTPI